MSAERISDSGEFEPQPLFLKTLVRVRERYVEAINKQTEHTRYVLNDWTPMHPSDVAVFGLAESSLRIVGGKHDALEISLPAYSDSDINYPLLKILEEDSEAMVITAYNSRTNEVESVLLQEEGYEDAVFDNLHITAEEFYEKVDKYPVIPLREFNSPTGL